MLAYPQEIGRIEIMDKRQIINSIIRKRLKSAKESRTAISRKTGINESVLSRFYHGASLSSENASILLDYFNYEIKRKQKRD